MVANTGALLLPSLAIVIILMVLGQVVTMINNGMDSAEACICYLQCDTTAACIEACKN